MALAEAGIPTSDKSLGPKQINLGDIDPLSRRFASILYQHGLRRGDYCQIVWPNTSLFQIAVLGIWLCEAIPSLCDYTFRAKGLALQMQDANPKVILATQYNLDTVEESLKIWNKSTNEVPIIVLGKNDPKLDKYPNFEGMVNDKKMRPPVPRQGPFLRDNVAALFWSSGTTGNPKGIQQTYNLFLHHMMPSKFITGIVIQSTLFFHIGGFVTPLHSVFHHTDYFFNGEDIAPDCLNILRAVDKFKPEFLVIGTHHCNQMIALRPDVIANLDLKSIKVVAPLGSTVHSEMIRDVKILFPNCVGCLNLYNMSELGPMVAFNMSPRALGGIGTGNIVKIADPDTGEALGPHQVGEIQVKPIFHMKGYLNRPKETAEFFGADGFCRTGDNGHYDEEGYLYYDNRLKDLMKPDNKHVYPMQIEDVMQRHPEVLEACAFGRPHPTAVEMVTAAVVLVSGSKLTEQDIKDMVANELESYKHLHGGVVFVKDGLPKNEQGKFLRKEMIKFVPNAKV
ncbi:hypothetical protein TCAL_06787 [Tigriopus californicus]|uniref:AMP-dependent synthetase/ligase domain-containing protein n=2 Tax=Tigriopus californicus TaxID=6832 RepID=A0A553PP56_TIGCA|nr:hypothetical protein TCAL_06787 [Tigriopus californicus]|eukprot:TCALIF_06787-PA protein Name:"Similar to 4CLL7 4-coumarate--CoA ligase-like 7 (Arabidopsis thaliana)" AED:0.04 eAED:0.04 QI:0/-1/0/1/-1/1/1/0/508